MKTIYFHCSNCEKDRNINIEEINAFYIIGKCSFCKVKSTINLKKLNAARSLRLMKSISA